MEEGCFRSGVTTNEGATLTPLGEGGGEGITDRDHGKVRVEREG